MRSEVKNIIYNRELIVKLAIKDLKLRYRRPLVGLFWAFLIPLAMIIIFQIVFSVILRVPIKEYPFFIYLMTAVFPWRFFQVSISRATTSILDCKYLVKGSAFPRTTIPISIVLAELLNFLPALIIMLIVLYCFKIGPSFSAFCLPLVIVLHTILIAGISLLFSGLQVRHRDIKYIVEILLIGLFYLTPVFYPLSMVVQFFDKFFLKVYLFNPLVGILNLYRITLLANFRASLPSEITNFYTLWLPLIWAFLFFCLGLSIFKRQEKTFSDYLSI